MPQLSAPASSYLLVLLAVMSVFLFAMMGIDKGKARRGRWRIPEKTLFVFALLGGALGGTAGMFAFRHKTKHWYFAWGFPILALLQIGLCAWLFLRGGAVL